MRNQRGKAAAMEDPYKAEPTSQTPPGVEDSYEMSSYTPSAHPTLPSGANQASAPKLGPHDHHRIAGEDYDNDEFLPPPASLKPTGVVTRWLSVIHENRGLLFLLISQFFGSLMNVIARILSTGLLGNQRFHALQILFVRQSITTAGCLIWMWYNGIFPLGDRKVRGLLVVRGLGGFFGVFGLYYSLTYLDLSDATVITFLAPIVASYACSIIPALKEPFTRAELGAAIVSLAGVILIARPESLFSRGTTHDNDSGDVKSPVGVEPRGLSPIPEVTPHQRLIAVLVALVGVFGAATAFTTIRWIGKRAHPLITVFYFSAWCAIVSFVSLMFVPSIGGIILPANALEWGLLVAIGICGFVMQFLLTAGLQREKAGRGTNMVYSQMLFALFWERVVWGTVPKWLSIVGSVMILGSVIFVGVRKSKKTVPKKELVVRDEEVGFLQEAEEREREQEQEYERERQQEQEQQREVENGVAGAPIRL